MLAKIRLLSVGVLISVTGLAVQAAITPEQAAQLPPPASHTIDFSKEIKPIFESSCIKCHGRGKAKGGLKIDNRETMLKGGDSGPVIVPGKSAQSLLIELVQGFDPDSAMPKKGSRLTPAQIGVLRAWIDQGATWDSQVTFARLPPNNLKPRRPELPAGPADANPIDRLLQSYYAQHKIKPAKPVDDRIFARRAYLDVIGLLPTPDELSAFIADKHRDKRERLVASLLARADDYAQNWLTFWNDLLRNDYKGTGYIDGGRKQITGWLYSALLTNMPYNQFVGQLIDPTPASEGFTKGIVWRGVVNASQTPQMQAAQCISQVFMGVNLKCASCHDSFINDLTLADSYGLAGLYADGPLEMVRCDKPTGTKADLKFLYPELGQIDPNADKPARLKQLADVITERQDARLTRTLVNRLWQRFFGRGLIEPVDDMEQSAWDADVLDWIAEDFADHNYDVRFLIKRILTSQAYQRPSVNLDPLNQEKYVFTGPAVRRMTAEEFRDAVTYLTGVGYSAPLAEVRPSESERKRFALPKIPQWIWNDKQAAERAKPGHVYFRKTVQLSVAPHDALAMIVCDNSFTLFVNGKQAGAGNDYKNAFLFDLRPFLKAGENLIAIDAVNHLNDNTAPPDSGAVPAGSENPAGLLFYARLRPEDNSATNDIISDHTWVCSDKRQSGWEQPAFATAAGDWQPAEKLGEMGMVPWRVTKEYVLTKISAAYPGKVRAALVGADPLTTALGRPNREQVVTTRPCEATTLQALEMTNGETLAEALKRGAKILLAQNQATNEGSNGKKQRPTDFIANLYEKALGRKPTSAESTLGRELAGQPIQEAGMEDLLWAVTMLPEFQLIY
jgi:mono/diheme cytochrome c family protein